LNLVIAYLARLATYELLDNGEPVFPLEVELSLKILLATLGWCFAYIYGMSWKY
jgi:hypothetical protein